MIQLILILISIVGGQRTLNNCFICANKKSHRMCRLGFFEKNPWDVQCCAPGDKSSECTEGHNNDCSPTFNDAGFNFYTYCPQIKPDNCGINNKDMVLKAYNDKQNFSYDKLSYTTFGSIATYQTCFYQVMKPQQYFTGESNLFLKFNKIGDGLNIYVTAGQDVRNSSIAVVKNNATVSLDQNYQIDSAMNFVITVVPKANNPNTEFNFEYYTDAAALPFFQRNWNALFVVPEKGPQYLILAAICAVLFLLIILCCCGFLIKSVCSKSAKINPGQAEEKTELSILKEYQDSKDGHANVKREESLKIVDLEAENNGGGTESRIGTDDGTVGEDVAGKDAGIQKFPKEESADIVPNYANPFGPNKSKQSERQSLV